jgi:hypothetical protein
VNQIRLDKKLLIKEINERLSYNANTGDVFWIKENKHHPRLLNKEAGHVFDNRKIIKMFGKQIKRSQIAFAIMVKYIPEIIDHIDGNSLNDSWLNLRAVNAMENVWNRHLKAAVSKKSKLPLGVRKMGNNYIARIAKNGKTHNLGSFKTPEEAHHEYLKAKK